MTTLTRATLGKLTKRQIKEVTIGDNVVRIQRPTPLEFSQYQMSLIGKDGKAEISKFADAILLLVARMWIDDEGQRLFKDTETKELGSIDLGFYQQLSAECQRFAQDAAEASKVLGESGSTAGSGSPVESVLSLE
jgi:hypothetical protein